MKREYERRCGGIGHDQPPDTCDGCGAAMKYKRICGRIFYACSACTDKAVAALGRTHDHIVLGIKR